jgi:uncharacterized protein
VTLRDFLQKPFFVQQSIDGLTIVQVKPGETVLPHHHNEGYVVVPFSSASLERITHHKGEQIKSERLNLEPLVPYFVEATKPDYPISLKNNGSGVSAFQKIVPRPPIKGPQPPLPTEKIAIVGHGTRHAFKVEMATTLIEQAAGLMFRKHLAPDHGMIFSWWVAREVTMYMRNVNMPLDFLFIDENFKVSHIHANATPEDSTPIYSQGKVLFTVELLGGTIAKLGIAKGDTMELEG